MEGRLVSLVDTLSVFCMGLVGDGSAVDTAYASSIPASVGDGLYGLLDCGAGDIGEAGT